MCIILRLNSRDDAIKIPFWTVVKRRKEKHGSTKDDLQNLSQWNLPRKMLSFDFDEIQREFFNINC